MRYFRIYLVFLKQYLKSLIEYRVDFLVGMFAFLLYQSLGIIFLYLIFEQINQLAGFSREQVLFMYGLSQIPKGIDHLFFDNIWLLPRNVRQGEIDRYLIRPINALYHFLIERFQPDAIGEIILGTIISIYAWRELGIPVDVLQILGLIVLVVIGSFIFTSVKLITASTAFWLKESQPLMQVVYNLSDYARYPIKVFPKAVQILFSYIVPFAFIAYFPASFIFGTENYLIIFSKTLLVTVLLVIIGLSIWNLGLRKYESTGS